MTDLFTGAGSLRQPLPDAGEEAHRLGESSNADGVGGRPDCESVHVSVRQQLLYAALRILAAGVRR